MSDRTDIQSLARQFAATLRHLSEAYDVHYVPAGPVPLDASAEAEPAMEQDSDGAPDGASDGTVMSPAPNPEPVRASRPDPHQPQARPQTRQSQAPSPKPSTPSGALEEARGGRPAPSQRVAPVQPSSSPSVPSSKGPPRASAVDAKQALRAQAAAWPAATKLEYLRRKNIGDCKRCALCKGRRNIVFGVGNPEAQIMFVGEAPGADEDRTGEPFVGRAGQRLDRWISDLGLSRDVVYIANVLKCRPPGNRDPRPEEVDKCSPFLKAQIRAIEPKVIVALGRHAGMLLARREDMSLGAMRRSTLWYDATGPKERPGERRIPLVVTYHPAYVLRQENGRAPGQSDATAAVMQDLTKAMNIVTAAGR